MSRRRPPRVLLEQTPGPWSECDPSDCRRCRGRDLAAERARGLSRICLGCLTWTWDGADEGPPPPPAPPDRRRGPLALRRALARIRSRPS